MRVSLKKRIGKIMYKWMYDRIVSEHSKKSKEELVQEIMSLEEIECSDRCFANECQAGATIYNINELFSELKELEYELFSVLKEQNQESTYKKSH